MYSDVRREAARLWADLVNRHYRIRRRNLKWPSKGRWCRWVKRRYPLLAAQSAQQIVFEFCEAVQSARQLRANGYPGINYPWRKSRYRDVTYTNQRARIQGRWLILLNGGGKPLRIRLPDSISLPGRLMEVRLCNYRIILICEIADEPTVEGATIGIDLGVNTLIAATDGKTAILINGREAKATVQWRAKRLASAWRRQSKQTKHSRRWRRLQRRVRRMSRKAKNRLKDLTHKATRLVADTFPCAKCYVGKPFNDASRRANRVQAQMIGESCGFKIIKLLNYKTSGVTVVEEHYSSQTCPVCGGRRKCRRTYKCRKCGITAPRDVIGSVNVLCIGEQECMVPGRSLPTTIKYLRPRCRSSSGGHPASSSRL